MIVYLLVIFVALIFIRLAQNEIYRNKTVYYFFSFVGLLILALFSAIRDLEVGFDVLYYQYDTFEKAKYSSSFMELIIWGFPLEPLFLFINYISAFFSDNIHVSLFFISFTIILFAYLACVKLNKKAPIWLSFALFMIYYYAQSNNIMRQSIAVSICFYAFSILQIEGVKLKFFIVSTLAILSHYTAFFPLILFLFIALVNMTKMKSFFFKLFILTCLAFYVLWEKLLSLMSLITNKDYSVYSGETAADWSTPHVSFPLLLFNIICFIIILWANRRKILDETQIYTCKYFIAVNTLCVFLAGYNGSASRLTLYFMAVLTFYLSSICNKKKKQSSLISTFLIVMYIALYFKQFYEGLEYSSIILGI